MAQKSILTFNNTNPTYEDIKEYSKDFKNPVLIKNLIPDAPIFQKWNKDYFLKRTEVGFENVQAQLHTGYYWARNPVAQEYMARQSETNFHNFFRRNTCSKYNSEYYLTMAKFEDGKFENLRPSEFNKFDKVILEDLPKFAFQDLTFMTICWLSMGGTKSFLHADPVNNIISQIQGKKRVFLVPDNRKLNKQRRRNLPHILDLKNPYEDIEKTTALLSKIDYFDLFLNPGDMLVIPMWCYHHLETKTGQLNISVSNHIQPHLIQKLRSRTYKLARFYRKYYPKLVAKRRLDWLVTRISGDVVPFFPSEVQFLQQSAKLPAWNKDARYYLINEKTKQIFQVKTEGLSEFLKQIDGKSTLTEISDSIGLDVEDTIEALEDLIRMNFLRHYINDNLDYLNYNYHIVEV